MKTSIQDPAREQIIALLRQSRAHAGLDDVVQNFPAKLRGVKPARAPYSAWQLLEHMRISQSDILEFCLNPKYVAMKWPDDYWPKSEKPANDGAWKNSISAIKKDLKAMEKLVEDPKTDLYTPFPHGTGQNVFAEALLIADHNAYHIGQLVLVRRLLGAWAE
jgi:hypothetical protein